MTTQEHKLWRNAGYLAWFTILYNLLEGLVSVFFGFSEEALTLFGFGLDSFIESISAAGVLVMIRRIKSNEASERTRFEAIALRITGWCFYGLSLVLAAGIFYNIYYNNQPESTLPGIIISLLSIFSMWWLITMKKRIGRQLDSSPIIADANCNLVCLYMSIVLLVASAGYYFFNIPYIDAVGTLALIIFSIREGREAFEKARSGTDTCSCHEGKTC